jgi:excisionase family DNA binding protein
MDKLCSIDEAAARLEVSRRTIDRFVARGVLASAKVGHRRKISVASIDAMLIPTFANREAHS